MLLLDFHSQAPECRQSATVDAFCRQCVRGGAFYGAPFVTCLEGCCCKSCVIYKKTGSPVCQVSSPQTSETYK